MRTACKSHSTTPRSLHHCTKDIAPPSFLRSRVLYTRNGFTSCFSREGGDTWPFLQQKSPTKKNSRRLRKRSTDQIPGIQTPASCPRHPCTPTFANLAALVSCLPSRSPSPCLLSLSAPNSRLVLVLARLVLLARERINAKLVFHATRFHENRENERGYQKLHFKTQVQKGNRRRLPRALSIRPSLQ